MNRKLIIFIWWCFLAPICFGVATTHDPWDGTIWVVTSPNDEALVGNTYKELYDLRKGVALRVDREHITLATSSAGGEHVQGSARAWFQDAAPGLQPDGTALAAGDLGMLWFDSNATPDNLVYVLTATTPTWTLISESLRNETLTWVNLQTFTAGILSNNHITLGAGDDLVGSSTSNITFNTNKFTVAGDTGNTLVAGTLDVTGVATIADASKLTTAAAPTDPCDIANMAYVDAAIAAAIVASVDFSEYTTEDDDTETLAKDHDYLATSDGFVYAYGTDLDTNATLYGWLHTAAGAKANGFIAAGINSAALNKKGGICFAVANGEYFEIESNESAVIVYWRSIGTLSKPTDQEAP